MAEKDFSADFVLLTKRLDPVRVENLLTGKTGLGTPDVNLLTGWVELKALKSYPKRPNTPVRIEHYTQEQRDWLKRRADAGGGAWLALRVRKEWYIWDAYRAQDVGNLTRQQLKETANFYFSEKPTADELCACFT